jgi:hypothetical protein
MAPDFGTILEIAVVRVRLYHIASVIVNANHSIMRAAAVQRVADCIRFASASDHASPLKVRLCGAFWQLVSSVDSLNVQLHRRKKLQTNRPLSRV